MNMQLFRWINDLAFKNAILDSVMLFSSQYLPYLIVLSMCVVFLFGIMQRKKELRQIAVSAALLVAANLLINLVLGHLVSVNRPFVSHKVNLLYPHVRDSSFPSDHATATMSTAAGLWKLNRVLGIVLAILSVFVGFSRIFVGHHYPADVIGSYAIVLMSTVFYRNRVRNKVESCYLRAEKKILSIMR